MQCEGFSFSWELLDSPLDKPHNYWSDAIQGISGQDRAGALVLQRNESRTATLPPLLRPIASFWQFESSNPRDKIYALLEISKETFV